MMRFLKAKLKKPAFWLGIATGSVALAKQFGFITITAEQQEVIDNMLLLLLG